MSTCAQKKAKQQRDIEKNQAARQKRNIHDMFHHEVEGFDAIIQKARRKLQTPVEQSIPYVSRIRISTKTQTQKVAVSKVGGEDTPSLERRATLSDKNGKTNKSV